MLGRYLFVAGPALALAVACSSSSDGPEAFKAGGGSKKSSSSSGGSNGTSGEGTSGTSGGSTSGAPAGGSSCADTAKAQCDFFNRCIPTFANGATCVRDQQLACERFRKYKGAETASIPATCLARFSASQCQGAFENEALQSSDCVSRGTLENGAACEIAAQCQTGQCTRTDVASACGLCSDFAIEGASCSGAECSPELRCVGPSGAKTCVKPAKLNEACTGASGCAYPNKCVAGLCTAGLADGTTCTSATSSAEDDPCEHRCQLDVCATVTSTFAQAGEACGSGLAGPFCASGTTCHGAEGAKKCVVNATVGEACDDTNGPECIDVATCTAGKCVEKAVDACK